MKLFLISLMLLFNFSEARRPIKEYVIDLDLPPSERFLVLKDFNNSIWKFYNDLFAKDVLLTDALYSLNDKRGPEVPELEEEIKGMIELSQLPYKFVKSIQMLYELQTLMLPVVNLTDLIPKEYQALTRLPWLGPGCTGIIARCSDNRVYHARNLDFAPLEYMKELVYIASFQRNQRELFKAQMIAGYSSLVTGFRSGKNGYTLERNTRYPDHWGGNKEMINNLIQGRPLNGFSLRKIMEQHSDYNSAVEAIALVPLVSTEYSIISGVQKGVIISRNPDSVVYNQTLGLPNVEERIDYIIMTNFDFFFHDFREWLDPSAGQFGHPRRIAAQKLLNQTKIGQLTPEYLFEVINSKGVFADTIFQAIMGVESNLWNVSSPW